MKKDDEDMAGTPELKTTGHQDTRKTGTVSRRKSSGQSLVEMALITPILLLMLIIAADFGRAYAAYVSVGSAAREGASYGSWSSSNANDPDAVRAAALADNPTIFGTAPQVTINNINDDGYGYEAIAVTVDYEFDVLFPFPPVPDTINMSRTVQMRVLGH